MHSSKIRTARLLTIYQHVLHRGCVYPIMHWAGGCVSQHELGRGVSAQGVSAQGGVPAQGVYLPRGVPAMGCTYLGGGCTCLGVYLPRGCVSQHAMGQTPPVDRQTPVKT